MAVVHAAIGNSDDKLSQSQWSLYARDFHELIRASAVTIYGVWYSLPDAPYQNGCIAAEVVAEDVPALREALTCLRVAFDQDSIALVVAEQTEFV